jgi:DNA polymerase-3 subunit beta
LDGEFLSIEQMLSKDYSTKIKINRMNLLNCIDRASLMANEGDKKPIIIDVKDENLELKISSFIGSMNESIDITKEGKDITIAFNPKFLIDALKVIDDEEITIYMINPKAPCYIKNDKESYLYLILPVNYV